MKEHKSKVNDDNNESQMHLDNANVKEGAEVSAGDLESTIAECTALLKARTRVYAKVLL